VIKYKSERRRSRRSRRSPLRYISETNFVYYAFAAILRGRYIIWFILLLFFLHLYIIIIFITILLMHFISFDFIHKRARAPLFILTEWRARLWPSSSLHFTCGERTYWETIFPTSTNVPALQFYGRLSRVCQSRPVILHVDRRC